MLAMICFVKNIYPATGLASKAAASFLLILPNRNRVNHITQKKSIKKNDCIMLMPFEHIPNEALKGR